VAQALLENPLLEREEEYDTDGAVTEAGAMQAPLDADPMAASASRGQASGDDDFARPEASQATSLQQHLADQLQLTRTTPRDHALVLLLIEELDENGYLSTPLEEIATILPAELMIEEDELQAALRLLQSFDPPGVGATSLSDCLTLQLRQHQGDTPPEVLACARTLARQHLGLLATGNLARLRQALECSQETLRAAHQLLLRLNPKPGRGWATSVADYINPEVIVRKVNKRWDAFLNPAVMPRLRVNTAYEQLIRQHARRAAGPAQEGAADDAGEETRSPARDEQDDPQAMLHKQAQQAHGLVKSVNQRFDTILRVARAVIRHQQAFFESGVQAMRPLVLRDIAQELDMHESTVSRATKQKYAQTPWGVFELKYFFGTALGTDDGDATSATAVRALIQELVAAEPSAKPLSDNQIAIKLAEQGVVIARRTVAKYREAAGIQPASLRRARAQLGRLA